MRTIIDISDHMLTQLDLVREKNAPEPPSFVKPSMPSWTETPKYRTSTNPWVYGKTRSATDSHIKKTFARNGRHNESRFDTCILIDFLRDIKQAQQELNRYEHRIKPYYQ